MASQFFVPGPSLIYTSTGAAGALEFLGVVEDEVRASFDGKYTPVYSDLLGDQVATDELFMGEEAYVDVPIIRYQEAVFQRVASRLNTAGQTAGAIQNNQVGSLMIQENFSFRLLIYHVYGTKTSMSGGGMLPALNFPTAWLVGPYDIGYGTRVKKPRLRFHALPRITVDSSGNVSYVLWNIDVTGRSSPAFI